MTKEVAAAPATYIPSARSTGSGRRNFGEGDKRRIVEEACREGASISGVARKYGIGPRLLFRWKQELAATAEPTILPVVLSDAPRYRHLQHRCRQTKRRASSNNRRA